jgi:hypothetical protein
MCSLHLGIFSDPLRKDSRENFGPLPPPPARGPRTPARQALYHGASSCSTLKASSGVPMGHWECPPALAPSLPEL